VGDRRDGWLKVADDTFARGTRLEWLAIRAGLHVVRFAHLGRRPVLGPPLPLRPGTTPFSLLSPEEKHRAALAGEPVGERHDLHWQRVAGRRGQLLRCVPPAALGLAAVSAASAGTLARHLRRARVPTGRPGRLTA